MANIMRVRAVRVLSAVIDRELDMGSGAVEGRGADLVRREAGAGEPSA